MSELAALSVLTFEAPISPSPDIGKRGELKWIATDKLRIDESYQRPVRSDGKRNIRRIAEAFHFSLFSPLIVAPRPGGVFAVIDGQHRAIAARLHGKIKELPALVLSCTHAEEARAFHTINGNITRVSIQYIFRARVAAGDAEANACVAACAEAGVRIMPYPVQSSLLKPGETLAAGTIEQCLKRYGREILVKALELITRTGDNAGLVAHEIIKGGCSALEQGPKWLKHPKLLETLGGDSVRVMRSSALQRAAEKGGAVSAHYADVLAQRLRLELGDGGTRVSQLTETQKAQYRAKAAAMTKVTGGGRPEEGSAFQQAERRRERGDREVCRREGRAPLRFRRHRSHERAARLAVPRLQAQGAASFCRDEFAQALRGRRQALRPCRAYRHRRPRAQETWPRADRAQGGGIA